MVPNPGKSGRWREVGSLAAVYVTQPKIRSFVRLLVGIVTCAPWPPEPKVTGSNPVGDILSHF
jgi:hypothetical protein